jgi:restriction endonuclease S subunit
MKRLYTGVGIKNISKSNIESIKILIPLMEQQSQIVKYCDLNTEYIQNMEQEIENNIQMAYACMDNLIKPQEGINVSHSSSVSENVSSSVLSCSENEEEELSLEKLSIHEELSV